MMPYTKEEVEDVKRIDLLTYLQIRRPDELIRTGLHEYRTVTHSSLVISNGKCVNAELKMQENAEEIM